MKKLILLFALISTLLVGCKKEDDNSFTLNKSSITLIAGESAQLTPSISGCSFTSGNPIIASVSASGKVRSYYVGDCKIPVTNGSDARYCEVKVLPKYSMYKEPYLMFGGSTTDIKANETRTLADETSTQLSFKGENSYILGVTYMFEYSKLTGVGCIIPNSHASLLGSFLAERYVFIKSDSNKNRIYYISPDQKIMVGVEVATISYSLVAYVPATSSKVGVSNVDAVMDTMLLELDKK